MTTTSKKPRQDDLCSTHQKNPTPGHRCETCARIRIEKKVMRRCLTDLIAAGYKVSIYNGECYEIVNSVKVSDIMPLTFLTDEDVVYVSKDDAPVTFVRFIYGNSGWDVINDYGVSLEPVMKGVMDYAETFEK